MKELKYLYISLILIFSNNAFGQFQSNSKWSMETRQETTSFIGVTNTTSRITGNRWAHDYINGAFISPNGWGFGGNAGGTGSDSGLSDAFVKWSSVNKNNNDYLQLQWFVGGYHRDFKGQPGHGWPYGGNNVKAYPRMGIGSASGQPDATSGTPFDIEPITTGGTTTVNIERVRQEIGIPVRMNQMPEIDIHVDLEFEGGSDQVSKRDQHGNYFFAIDSYYHDIDTPSYLANPSLVGSINGINDSSGTIYNTNMRDLPDTTKRWATMVWYHKPAYYESSGGYELTDNQYIDGQSFTIKYKVENASDKLFKYVAFIMNRETTDLVQGGKQPVVRYKRFAEFLTDGRLQKLLDQHRGRIQDIDGSYGRIMAPSPNMVLTDINIGVEVLSNPDTSYNTTPKPVAINFSELYFAVKGKGDFGFKANNRRIKLPAQPSPAPDTQEPLDDHNSNNIGECVDTGVIGDGFGWNEATKSSCRIPVGPVTAPAQPAPVDSSNNQCVDTGVIGDGFGWNEATRSSCRIPIGAANPPVQGNNSNTVGQCVDTGVIGDGFGWNEATQSSCRIN